MVIITLIRRVTKKHPSVKKKGSSDLTKKIIDSKTISGSAINFKNPDNSLIFPTLDNNSSISLPQDFDLEKNLSIANIDKEIKPKQNGVDNIISTIKNTVSNIFQTAISSSDDNIDLTAQIVLDTNNTLPTYTFDTFWNEAQQKKINMLLNKGWLKFKIMEFLYQYEGIPNGRIRPNDWDSNPNIPKGFNLTNDQIQIIKQLFETGEINNFIKGEGGLNQ
jgi:hypothetical protein